MQRTAHIVVLVCAVALLTGCEDKNKGMETDPAQASSVAYEEPSYSYYAPDAQASASSADPYGYSTTDDSAAVASSTHVVAKGDTLYALARMYYSDQSKWKNIYEANRHVLRDPNVLLVGQELTIP